jgi:hypothetical protein
LRDMARYPLPPHPGPVVWYRTVSLMDSYLADTVSARYEHGGLNLG